MFDKIMVVEEGLDITLSYWAEVVYDEDYENIQADAEHVIQERKNFVHLLPIWHLTFCSLP